MIDITMFPPEVFNALADRFNDDALDEVIRNVAHAARGHWIKLVSQSPLVTTKRDYIGGLQAVSRRGQNSYVISLVGKLPMILESGQAAYDMRRTLLGPNVPTVTSGGGGKRKNKDGGFYRAIPFGHATAGASGAGGVNPMGRAYEGQMAIKDAKRLGKDVYGQAKELGDYATTKETLVEPEYRAKGPKGAYAPVPKLKPIHSTDIYSGMIRNVQQTKGGEQSTYTTFRMISTTGGNPETWLRPATQGLHLAPKVSSYVARVLPAALEAFGKGIGG